MKAWNPSSQTSLFCNSEIRWSRKLSRHLAFLGCRLPNGLFWDYSRLFCAHCNAGVSEINVSDGCYCIRMHNFESIWKCCTMFTLLHAKALFSPSRWNMNFNPLACYRNFLSCRKWSIIKIWHFIIFKNEFSLVSIILYSDTQRLKPVNYTVELLGSLRKNLFTVFWQSKTLQQWNRENTGMANVW